MQTILLCSQIFILRGKKTQNVSHGDIKINLKGQRDGV